MGDKDIGSAIASDLANVETAYSVTAQSTDGVQDQKETTYQNTTWTTNYGYYKKIPELKIAVDTKANWVIGNGYSADEETTLLLDTIKGNGKDSFNSILENMERTSYIGEDAYSEVIRDKEGMLRNLKPLSPDTIVVVQNRKGRVKRYEQVSRIKGRKNKRFKPEEIFVLSHNRTADEIHGESIIPTLKWIIDARNESMADMRTLMHRHVKPRNKFMLDTDDVAKVTAFKKKEDAAAAAGENMYIPKGAVEHDLISVPQNSTLNPIAWQEKLNDYFFQAVGVPQIIVGNAKSFTDASGKIVYLAFEQRIKGRQLYVEEQVLNQLQLEIKLTFPASLQNEAISDTPTETDVGEEEPMEQAVQPNDQKEELEGKQ